MELSETKWLALKGISGIIAIHLDGLSKAKENLDLLLTEMSEENRPRMDCLICPSNDCEKESPPQENIWTCLKCGQDVDGDDFPKMECQMCGEPACPECVHTEMFGMVWCKQCQGETSEGASSEKQQRKFK